MRVNVLTPAQPRLPSFDLAPHGVIGGGQVGYNWQVGDWVFGIEADIQASGVEERNELRAALCCRAVAAIATQELPWFGTVRGRIGTAMGGLQLYQTAGFAYGEVEDAHQRRLSADGPGRRFHQTRSGWTAGSGVEAGARRQLDRPR